MKLETLVGNIGQNWRRDFIAFVQTGDASPEFLTYLDGSPEAQAAVEQAFTAQARAFEGLAQLVKTSGPTVPETPSTSEGVSTAVARAVERIADLPGEERANAVAVAARTLARAAAAEPGKADTLLSTVSALHQEIDSLVG
jgi:hypothetical protein